VSTVRRYRVLFDPDAIAEDLAHATKAARQIGEQAVDRLKRDGISRAQLFACKAEERDGTRLPGCVKTYLPWPDGRCGMVFELASTRTASCCSVSRSGSGIPSATPDAPASTRSQTAAYINPTPNRRRQLVGQSRLMLATKPRRCAFFLAAHSRRPAATLKAAARVGALTSGARNSRPGLQPPDGRWRPGPDARNARQALRFHRAATVILRRTPVLTPSPG
jgi:hypothetical protein